MNFLKAVLASTVFFTSFSQPSFSEEAIASYPQKTGNICIENVPLEELSFQVKPLNPLQLPGFLGSLKFSKTFDFDASNNLTLSPAGLDFFQALPAFELHETASYNPFNPYAKFSFGILLHRQF